MTYGSNICNYEASSAIHEKSTKEGFKAIIECVVGVSYKHSLSRFDLAWKYFEVERHEFVLHFSY